MPFKNVPLTRPIPPSLPPSRPSFWEWDKGAVGSPTYAIMGSGFLEPTERMPVCTKHWPGVYLINSAMLSFSIPSEALEDLEAALKLSKGAGPVARQGFVQRGLIQRLQGQDEAARSSFEQAAALGSIFARQQLALMNPYAALCNQMLSEVMRKSHPKVEKETC